LTCRRTLVVMRRRNFLRTVLIGSGIGGGLASRYALAASAQGTAVGTRKPATPPRGPIIDVHMHAYPAGEAIPADATNPVTGRPPGVKDGEAHLQACLAEMKRLNIVKGVVSGGSGDRLGAAIHWRDAAPDRIIAGAGVRGSEDTPLPPLDVLRKEFADGRLRVLGEVTAQYAGHTLDDRKYQEYLALAEELNVPVAVHTGLGPPGISYDPCCRGFRASLGNPALLEEALNRHPKLRVNVMHGGWPYLQETVALLLSYPRVYTDLGAINWILPRAEFHAYLGALMRAGLGKRILFGSDQMYWPEAIGMAVDAVHAATFLTPSARRDIFHDNAVRFLELTPS
jgi:predicted TIM-barrel fold metal-dependent hydrolase